MAAQHILLLALINTVSLPKNNLYSWMCCFRQALFKGCGYEGTAVKSRLLTSISFSNWQESQESI